MVKKVERENSFAVKKPEVFQILTKEEYNEIYRK